MAAANGKETVSGYKARLRWTALRMLRKVEGKAVAAIRKRANAVFEAKGGHISKNGLFTALSYGKSVARWCAMIGP